MQKPNIYSFRVGNIVNHYSPSLNIGHVPYAVITDIKPHSDFGQWFWMRDLHNAEKTFVGYSDNVSNILLTEDYLRRLQFEEVENIFVYQNLRITSGVYYENSEKFEGWVLTGFITLPPNLYLPLTPQDIKDKCVHIPTLHSLQNFMTDINLQELEFSLLPRY